MNCENSEKRSLVAKNILFVNTAKEGLERLPMLAEIRTMTL